MLHFAPAIRLAGIGILLAAQPALAQDSASKAHEPMARRTPTAPFPRSP